MIRIGFLGYSNDWPGGQNYLLNLFYAISQMRDRKIEPIVILEASEPEDVVNLYRQHATVLMKPLLKRYQLAWWLDKASFFLSRKQKSLEPFLLKNNIQVFFSLSGFHGFKRIKVLTWIPDFQHKHLERMFNASEIVGRDKNLQAAVSTSARIILSSKSALNDLTAFAPQAVSKTRVLNFVGQVASSIFSVDEKDIGLMKLKYDLPAKFFYLPNQLWKHKNHIAVFEAVHQLKKEGLRIPVVCSGAMHDYRNIEHIESLKNFIADQKLGDEIIFLGKISMQDVYLLYAAAFAVINPSLFEGWSTTVEECKTLGKRVLLSDIPVHREQSPLGGVYFDPEDSKDIALKLKQIWTEENQPEPLMSADDLQESLKKRTLKFANSFQDIVEEVLRT